jgi:hypothetical protein
MCFVYLSSSNQKLPNFGPAGNAVWRPAGQLKSKVHPFCAEGIVVAIWGVFVISARNVIIIDSYSTFSSLALTVAKSNWL